MTRSFKFAFFVLLIITLLFATGIPVFAAPHKMVIPLAADTQEDTNENKMPAAEAWTFTVEDAIRPAGQSKDEDQYNNIIIVLAVFLVVIVIGMLLLYFIKGRRISAFSCKQLCGKRQRRQLTITRLD